MDLPGFCRAWADGAPWSFVKHRGRGSGSTLPDKRIYARLFCEVRRATLDSAVHSWANWIEAVFNKLQEERNMSVATTSRVQRGGACPATVIVLLATVVLSTHGATAATCADILTTECPWQYTTCAGIDLRAYTNDKFHWIGCCSNGCISSDWCAGFPLRVLAHVPHHIRMCV